MTQIETYNRLQRRALRRASRDRLTFGQELRPVVTVGPDQYYRDDLVSCTYEGSDGIACMAEIEFRTRVPRNAEQKHVRIDFLVDVPEERRSVRLPGFSGYCVSRGRRGYSITAATGGYEAERTPLGEGPADDVEFAKVAPGMGLFDTMMKLRRRYAGYEIGPFEKPLLDRRGADRFTWNQYVKEVADYCAEIGKFVIADTPTNVAFAYLMRGVDREEKAAWNFEQGIDCDEVGDETPDGERYHRVVVHSQPDPAGKIHKLAEAEVNNHGYDVFPSSVLMHALDPDPEVPGEPRTDPDSAWVTAYRLARQVGRNDTEVTVDPNYPPFFVRRGDVMTATGKEFKIRQARGMDRAYPGPTGTLTLLRYIFRVENFQVDALEMSGSVSGEGLLVGIEQTDMELPNFDRRSVAPAWGLLPDTNTAYFDESLRWIRRINSDTAEIDTEKAREDGVEIEEIPEGGWAEVTDEDEE